MLSMNLKMSRGLNSYLRVKNFPYSIIFRSRMSLTRHSKRLICEMTIMIEFLKDSLSGV